MQLARAVAAVADHTAEQWGMVTAAQAKAVGVSGVTLLRMVEAGLLERVRRGCYILTAASLPAHVQMRAAWLLLNPTVPAWSRPRLDPDGGVISHSSAALIHGVGDLHADAVEITVPRRRGTRESDLRLRLAVLESSEVVLVDGLPVTTVERTIVDHLADHHDGGHIGQMIHQAVRADQVDVEALAARVGRYNRRYGVPGRDGRVLVDYLLKQGGNLIDDLARPARDTMAQAEVALATAIAQDAKAVVSNNDDSIRQVLTFLIRIQLENQQTRQQLGSQLAAIEKAIETMGHDHKGLEEEVT